MKLSEKGIEKVQNYSSVDLEIEGFEPDDFQGVVVLTVEEAKRMLDFVEGVNIVGGDVQQYIFQIFKPLKERIEQAEKGNEVE